MAGALHIAEGFEPPNHLADDVIGGGGARGQPTTIGPSGAASRGDILDAGGG